MAIRKVILANGKADEDVGWGNPQRRRVISDGIAYTVTKILEQNVLYGTGTRANFGRPAAGKTGTTDDHADAWFCGYLPNLQATVWVGYPQGEIPMQNVHGIAVAGGSFPAEIWRRFMEQATRYSPAQDFSLPRTYPTWTSWQRGNYDIVYQATSTSTSTTTTTTPATTRGDDGRTDAADDHAPQTTTQSVTIPVQPTTTVVTPPPTTTAPPSTTIAPPPTTTEVTTTQPARRRVSSMAERKNLGAACAIASSWRLPTSSDGRTGASASGADRHVYLFNSGTSLVASPSVASSRRRRHLSLASSLRLAGDGDRHAGPAGRAGGAERRPVPRREVPRPAHLPAVRRRAAGGPRPLPGLLRRVPAGGGAAFASASLFPGG